MNLTFVGNSSPMGINEKVRCKYLDQIMILLVSSLMHNYITNNFTINFQSNVAIYGRRSEAPTITNYDWVHMITEDGDVKIVKKVLSKYLT